MKIVRATRRKRAPLRGSAEIGIQVGRVLAQFKVGKHFRCQITEDRFTYERDEEAIRAEAELDGLYVIRTRTSADVFTAEAAVSAYKSLSVVRRAFRTEKTELEVRRSFTGPRSGSARAFCCSSMKEGLSCLADTT